MKYYANEFYSTKDYIAHYGLKGQKWGDRNGTNYPLKPGEHSAEEIRLNNIRFDSNNKNKETKKEKLPLMFKIAKKMNDRIVKKMQPTIDTTLQNNLSKALSSNIPGLQNSISNLEKITNDEKKKQDLYDIFKSLDLPVSNDNGSLTAYGKARLHNDLSEISNSLNKSAANPGNGDYLDNAQYQLQKFLKSFDKTLYNNLSMEYIDSNKNGQPYVQTKVKCLNPYTNKVLPIDSQYGDAVFISDILKVNKRRN